MLLLVLLLCLCPPLALAEEVSANGLIDEAGAYDGRRVVFSGEVVGDILESGDHVWLNVSDGGNAVGVWVERGLARDIRVAGRYAQRGDIVRVTGKFNRACPEHGGDFDIHAQRVDLVERGYPVTHPVPRWKAGLAIALPALAMVLMALAFSRTARRLFPRSRR